jgi:thiamine-phosphate pyrophosphorylase
LDDKKQRFNRSARELYCFADNLPLCEKLLAAGARIIQLREKSLDDQTFLQLAREMMSLVRKYEDAVLIINDRVEIALEVAAHGVHVGQEDENYLNVLRRVPQEMIVGVSVDTVTQAVAAEIAGATYLGAGAVFRTPTKIDAVVIGLEGLQEIVQAVQIPVVAIGGISLENIGKVVPTGAQYYAIISQINSAPDIKKRIDEFNDLISRG